MFDVRRLAPDLNFRRAVRIHRRGIKDEQSSALHRFGSALFRVRIPFGHFRAGEHPDCQKHPPVVRNPYIVRRDMDQNSFNLLCAEVNRADRVFSPLIDVLTKPVSGR